MRLYNYITESFNRPYKYKCDGGYGDYDIGYSFETDAGIKYTFDAVLNDEEDGKNSWDIAFYLKDYKNKINLNTQYYFLSGTGDAMRVMATILVIIKDFIKQIKPQYITFDAKEKSRQKLYDRMIKVLSSKFGYKLDRSYKVNSKYYRLVKK